MTAIEQLRARIVSSVRDVEKTLGRRMTREEKQRYDSIEFFDLDRNRVWCSRETVSYMRGKGFKPCPIHMADATGAIVAVAFEDYGAAIEAGLHELDSETVPAPPSTLGWL